VVRQATVGALAAGDFNGDGQIDVALVESGADRAPSLEILANRFGELTSVLTLPVCGGSKGTQPTAIVAADLDADGKTDLVIACTEQDLVSVLRNDG
jgi:hypothetical protein